MTPNPNPNMPIQLLHFADLHLGVENYGRVNPATGLNSRFEDFAHTLDSVVSTAIDRGVHLVVFAGDAYKNRDPSPTHQRTFAAALRRLSAAGIPTLVLVGNHDIPNTRGRAHAVEVFRVLEVPHVIVADRPDLHHIETPAGEVQVLALPYRRPSAPIEREEDLRGKPQSEIAEHIARTYREQLEMMAERLNPDLPTVLAAHLYVGGAEISSERSMMLGDEPAVSLSTLTNPDLHLDYVALGHVHKFQNMNRGGYPPVIYSGSLERVDFGEEKDEKGFVLVRLVRDHTTYEFVPVKARRFVTVECDLSGEDPMDQLEAAVQAASIDGAIVRLRYTIPEDKKTAFSGGELNRLLSKAFCVGRVEREVTRPGIRQRDPHLTDSIDALGALDRYLSIKPPQVDAAEVREYGRALIQELQKREQAL